MHYVKYFDINGVATKQAGCIELRGKPNAATEGCVGVLGMDMSSPTHDVYKCVAVKGGLYTWELLSSGGGGGGSGSVTIDETELNEMLDEVLAFGNTVNIVWMDDKHNYVGYVSTTRPTSSEDYDAELFYEGSGLPFECTLTGVTELYFWGADGVMLRKQGESEYIYEGYSGHNSYDNPYVLTVTEDMNLEFGVEA
jgi:hypothetical protein